MTLATITNRAIRCALLPLILMATTDAAGAADREALEAARCRRHLSISAGDYFKEAASAFARCHEQQMLGRLPAAPGLDCNDTSTWAAGGYPKGLTDISRKAQRLAARTARVCAGSLPSEFNTCPAPCAGSVASASEADQCLRCLTDSCVAAAFSATHGQPPAVTGRRDEALQCQSHIGRTLVSYAPFHARGEAACRYRQEIGRLSEAVDCSDFEDGQHPGRSRFERRVEAMDSAMQSRCGGDPDTLGSVLDSCATSPVAESGCVRDQARSCAAQIFDTVSGNIAAPEGCCAEASGAPRTACFLPECEAACRETLADFLADCDFCDGSVPENCESERCLGSIGECIPKEDCLAVYEQFFQLQCAGEDNQRACIRAKSDACTS